MDIDYDELCPTTQQQVAHLLSHESHIEKHGDSAVTDIRSVSGAKLNVSELKPDSIIEVDGITGKVEHMIEAGLVSESIYSGSYDDIEPTTREQEAEPEAVSKLNTQALDTTNQIEEVLGTPETIDTFTAVLAGDGVSPDILAELSESYGVTTDHVEREIHEATEQLLDDFTDYAESELGVADVEHFSEWVAYAVNQDQKTKQLYQQAVTGALNGDFTLSQDLVQKYKQHYRIF